jgi:hypothetical protein
MPAHVKSLPAAFEGPYLFGSHPNLMTFFVHIFKSNKGIVYSLEFGVGCGTKKANGMRIQNLLKGFKNIYYRIHNTDDVITN